VEGILIQRAYAEDSTGGMRRGEPYGGEARALSDDAGDHVPQRQLPCTGRAQGLCDPQASGDVVDGPHGTKRQPWLQGARVLDGPEVFQLLLVSQRQPYGVDLRGGTRTEIGNGAVEDLAGGAIRRA